MIEEEFEKKLRTLIGAALKMTEKNFDDLARKIAMLISTKPTDVVFKKRLIVILGIFNHNLETIITAAMAKNWELANLKNDLLVKEYSKNIGQSIQGTEYFKTNISALKSFINRTEEGMNLSKRIWEISDGFHTQLKTYLGAGITEGKSSASISQDIRLLLKEPDRLFRRVRNASGKLVPSKPMKLYHPGIGVYRSSYQNALRLTATETNMAYRMGDHVRRQQLDFIMGFRVNLSHSHLEKDLCDFMAGDYPKTFVFRSWHPRCYCFTTSILMSGSEYRRMQESGNEPKRMIHEIPGEAKTYLKKNKEVFNRLSSKPYFIQDNAGALAPFIKP